MPLNKMNLKIERKVDMSENNDSWAVVELMGHVALAGRVTKPGEYGGLWQIDIPDRDTFRTEFFGSQSVYRIRMVSEQIARGYARPNHEVVAYDAPILTREEHETAMSQAQDLINNLRSRLNDAERQLHQLPAGSLEPWDDDDNEDNEDSDDE